MAPAYTLCHRFLDCKSGVTIRSGGGAFSFISHHRDDATEKRDEPSIFARFRRFLGWRNPIDWPAIPWSERVDDDTKKQENAIVLLWRGFDLAGRFVRVLPELIDEGVYERRYQAT